MNTIDSITQARLKEVLHYDPETGFFTWLTTGKGRRIDQAAGCFVYGYISIMIDGVAYRAQRLAWLYVYGKFPDNTIDHKDLVRHNNWISNLRDITQAENNRNKGITKRNKSGVNGVHWCKSYKSWVAQIKVNGKSTHLGKFNCITAAAIARAAANIKYGYHANHGQTSPSGSK